MFWRSKIKRYMVFAYESNYPDGGMYDLLGVASRRDKAVDLLNRGSETDYDTGHIYDLREMAVVDLFHRLKGKWVSNKIYRKHISELSAKQDNRAERIMDRMSRRKKQTN